MKNPLYVIHNTFKIPPPPIYLRQQISLNEYKILYTSHLYETPEELSHHPQVPSGFKNIQLCH